MLADATRRFLAPTAPAAYLVAFVAALAATSSLPAQQVVTDDLGRVVRFEQPPCRVVSLIPAATEILYAIGAGECLVGRSTWDDYPPEVESVADVGQAIGASVERVIIQRPDLVLLIAGQDNARTVEEFARLGVPTLVLRMNRLSDLRSAIDRLGDVLAREPAADSLWSAIDAEISDVERRTADLERPLVYYDIAHPPPITVGHGSYLDSLIVIAGGRNVFHDVEAPSPTVSLEAIAVRDPDVILFPVSAAWGGASSPADRAGWSALRAVREGRVERVDADLLHRLGPRVGRAVRGLAEILHPTAFPAAEP